MTEEPDSIVLRDLRRIDGKLDSLTERVDDLTSEMRSVRTHMAGFMNDHSRHDEGVAALRVRMDRIERRLDLVEGGE